MQTKIQSVFLTGIFCITPVARSIPQFYTLFIQLLISSGVIYFLWQKNEYDCNSDLEFNLIAIQIAGYPNQQKE